jgi:hypothetical protein
MRQTGDLVPRTPKRGHAEKDSGETNGMKNDNSSRPTSDKTRRFRDICVALEKTLRGKTNPVQSSPDNESPVGPVPHAAEEHGYHQI